MKIVLTFVLAFAWGPGAAQSVLPPGPPIQAVRNPLPPFVDPAEELKGLALIKALRAGGFVLYMRHALAGWPKPSCSGEAGLTEEGEEQARLVGAALHELKIPVAVVRASETCRAKDTARLIDIGEVTTSLDLNPTSMRPPVGEYAQQFKYLLQIPPHNSNTLLVSHVQGSQTLAERILIEPAEIVVYRSRGTGKAVPLARIPHAAWAGLIAAARAEPVN